MPALLRYPLPAGYSPANGYSRGATADATDRDSTVCTDGRPFVALAGTAGNAIGKVNADGSITLFSVPSQIAGITTGTDGAIWFTEVLANKIGRITY